MPSPLADRTRRRRRRSGKTLALLACAGSALVILALGVSACSPPARHAALTLFFDGVPPLAPPAPPPGSQAAVEAQASAPMRAGFLEHGPYGAKLCNACHLSTASNSYVAPKQQLCAQCHDLELDKAYIHGPIQSEGCTSCHDPHSSPYRYLLTGNPETFCYRCHDKQDVDVIPAHADAKQTCTGCHDPHQSDEKHLLRAKG